MRTVILRRLIDPVFKAHHPTSFSPFSASFSLRFSGTMPAQRTASKRKNTNDDSDIEEGAQIIKKSRQETKTSSNNTQPTNKTLPVTIDIPPKIQGTTRIVSWNVSGYAASSKKGFSHYVEAEDADILILTETKLNQKPAASILDSRYSHQYWSSASKKGYGTGLFLPSLEALSDRPKAGTAVLSKQKPLSIDETIPGHPDPASVKGRIITLEFETCYLVGTYVVNAGQGLKTLEEKKTWNTHFFEYLRSLDKKKPVVWAGDLNVAPTELDLANPKQNWNKTPGYTEAETTAFNNFLKDPEDADAPQFIDMWRKLHPGVKAYSYFSYRFNCREKGLGWRIDGMVLSQRLEDRVKICEIRDEIYGASDHCPVVMEISGTL